MMNFYYYFINNIIILLYINGYFMYTNYIHYLNGWLSQKDETYKNGKCLIL